MGERRRRAPVDWPLPVMIAFGCLSVAVGGAALAIGSVHLRTLLVVALFAGGSVALVWRGHERVELSRSVVVVALTLLGLTAYTALQLLPLPLGLLRQVAPANAQVWAAAGLPWDAPAPTLAPISVDPVATATELVRGGVYLAIFLAAARLANRPGSTSALHALLVGSALVVGAVSLAHTALHLDTVYGFYRPMQPRGSHMGPLLNPNHFAGYMVLASCVALGSFAGAPTARVRWPAVLAWLVLVGLVVQSGSRGGVLALIVGNLLVIVGHLTAGASRRGRRRRGERTRQKRKLSIGLTVLVSAAAVVVLVVGASESALNELADTDFSKLESTRHVLRAAFGHFAVFGSGRGSFESVYPAFKTSPEYMTFTHPENLVAQWVFEWGVPVSLVAALALATALHPRYAVARGRRALGPWAGLVALILQNMVDFSLEIPGVTVAAIVALALVTANDPRPGPTLPADGVRVPLVAAASATVLFFGVALSVRYLGHELREDVRTARTLAAAGPREAERLDEHVRASIGRHPAEPYLYYADAVGHVRSGRSPLALLGQTLDRSPVYPPAHALLAFWLRSRAPAQALFEYRLAATQDVAAAPRIVDEALSLVTKYEDAMQLVPTGPARRVVLDHMSQKLRARLPSTAARLRELLAASGLPSTDYAKEVAELHVGDLAADDSSPWCSERRIECTQHALDAIDVVLKLQPERCDGYRLRAQALLLSGAKETAVEYLRSAGRTVEDRKTCLKALVSLAWQAGNRRSVSTAIDAFVTASCAAEHDCVADLQWAASIETQLGNSTKAFLFLKQALERAPERVDVMEQVASRASSLGLHGEAATLFRTLTGLRPAEPRFRAALAHEEEEALRRATSQSVLPAGRWP